MTSTVHGWRGEMIDLFAQAELQITEALIDMKLANGELLLGARMRRLADAIAKGGSHAEVGATARNALARCQRHLAFRHALCHGQLQVATDREGKWIAIWRMTRLRPDQVERLVTVLGEDEALTLRQAVRSDVANLRGQLRQMLATMTGSKAPAKPLGPEPAPLLQPAA